MNIQFIFIFVFGQIVAVIQMFMIVQKFKYSCHTNIAQSCMSGIFDSQSEAAIISAKVVLYRKQSVFFCCNKIM